MKDELKVFYDQDSDILYLAREGEEEEAVEVYPGVSLELNQAGEVIGVEILRASQVLKDIIEPLRRKAIA